MNRNDKRPVVADADQDEQFNQLVLRALEQDGSLIPSTPDGVARAEPELPNKDAELPASLATFDDALQLASEKRLMNCAPLQMPTGMEENLARAAREGGEVPPQVEAQMRADRAAAEDHADGQGQH